MLVPIFVTGKILLFLFIFKQFPSWNNQRAPFPAGGDDWELPRGEGGLRQDNLPQVDAAHPGAAGIPGGRPHDDRLRHVAPPLATHHQVSGSQLLLSHES